MSGLKAPLHGRTHLPGGSDPIPATAGSGIQFDTDPQDGGYLHVTTNSFDPSDDQGAGIGLYTAGGNAMVIGAYDDGWVQLLFNPDGGGGGEREIRLTDTRILLNGVRTSIDLLDGASAGLETIDISTAGGASVSMTTDSIVVKAGAAPLLSVDGGTSQVLVNLEPGGSFLVTNDTDDPIFQVDEDGTIHILTGNTITADL